MGPQAPHRTQPTASAFLTDVKDESEPLRKTEPIAPKADPGPSKIGSGVLQKPLTKKIEPESSVTPSARQAKAASPQAKSSKIPELSSSKATEKESNDELRTKLAALLTQLEQLLPKIKQRKLASGLENVQKAGKALMSDQTADKAKGLKQSLNKAAMAFLIIESSKHQVMKKDFNQTLQGVKQFLPKGGDQTLKHLIQGANAAISPQEATSQFEDWINLLKECI